MGRKPKEKLSLREQEDEVIMKYICGEPMTLEEAALALWMSDGRKTKKPMTKMGYLKFEQKILAKLKNECAKVGITADDLALFARKGQSHYDTNASISEC